MVEGFLVEQLARVLKCSPSKVDVHESLNRLGIDSLMVVELKNRVDVVLELALPVTVLLQGPSLAQLTTHLLEQLAPAPCLAPSASASAHEENGEQLVVDVDELSDEEVDALLRDLADKEEDVTG